MDIARYYATLGVTISKKEIAKVDSTLKALEAKLKAFGKKIDRHLRLKLDISKFDIDQKKLNLKLGNALDLASARTVFEVSNFVVDQRRLNMSMTTAMRRAAQVAEQSVRVRPDVDSRIAGRERDISPTRLSGRTAVGAGIAGGLTSRMYGPAIAVAMGGYGLGQVMKANEAVVAARLQTQAVSQAYGGTAQQGNENFEWLKSQADRVGFSWIDTVGDFNTLTSNLVGAGQTTEDARTVFKGFAEYGRVNKLSDARQQLVFSALGQVAGKDKLQAEELTKQLGNSLPGAKSIFAEAWQRKTGGRLKGAESIQALEKAMKEGNVRGDILTIAAEIASEMAAPGLSTASKASQAERNRFKNQRMASYEIAAEAGVEGGFARTFKTLSITLKESDGLVASMARGFERATIEASKLLLWPQSFKRALEGRDSLVADWLGADATAQLKEDWTELERLFQAIAGKETPQWMPSLEATTRELAALLRVGAAIAKGLRNAKNDAAAETPLLGDNWIGNALAGAAGFIMSPFTRSEMDSAGMRAGIGMPAIANDTIINRSFDTPDPFSAAKNARDMSYNSFGMPQASLDMKVDVTIAAANPEDFQQQFKDSFKINAGNFLMEAMPAFTNKESH
jgi:hypothetical protein